MTAVRAEASTGNQPPPGPTALRDAAPLAVAVAPFALAIGATIASSGVPAPAGLAGSVLLMAGASQLAAIDQVAAGAGLVVAIGTALMINVRLVLYGAGLATWFDELPRWRRMLLAIPLVDQTFVLGERRFADQRSTRWRERYYLTATALLFACFVGFQVVGYFVGGAVPSALGLHLAAPLAFAGLLGLACDGRRNVTAAAVAAVTLLVAADLPGGVSLPIAAVAGLVAGSLRAGEARHADTPGTGGAPLAGVAT
jgi:branched chain amino acid efflux pump